MRNKGGNAMLKKLSILLLILVFAFTGAMYAMETNHQAFVEEDAVLVFQDVDISDWFYEDVIEARRLGLVQGVGDNQFAPSRTISNAEFITVLIRILDIDLSRYDEGTHWANQSMLAALDLGIITEDELENMRYDDKILRQDMMKYTCRALNIEPSIEDEIIFSDVKPEDAPYINAAYKEYLTEGDGRDANGIKQFGYDKTTDRAQLATMVLRIKSYKEDPETFKSERAELREKADTEWESQREKDLQEKSTDEKVKVIEGQFEPEIFQEARKIGEEIWELWEEIPPGGWTIPDENEFNEHKNALQKFLSGEKRHYYYRMDPPKAETVLISKELHWKAPQGFTRPLSGDSYIFIIDNSELWRVEIEVHNGEYEITHIYKIRNL